MSTAPRKSGDCKIRKLALRSQVLLRYLKAYPPTHPAAAPSPGMVGEAGLELIIASINRSAVKLLELVTETARLRAHCQHRARVLLALFLRSPVGAIGRLVLADVAAHAARCRAAVMHELRTLRALVVQCPDGARCRVCILAHVALATDAAREWARLQGIPGVGGALALLTPSRTVVVEVFARTPTHATRDRTV